MSTIHLAKKMSLSVIVETTQGTPASPTATDFLLVEDLDPKPIDVEMIERNPNRSGLAPVAAIAGKRFASVTFKTELKGSGTAGTAYTPLGALLQACGMTETPDPGVDVTYAVTDSPASANFFGPGKSVTINAYKDGRKHIISGAIGTVKCSFEAGKIAFLEFDFRGDYAEPTDTAPGTETPLENEPPVVVSTTLAFMGDADRVASKLDFDFQNEIAERADVESAGGLKGFLITGRNPVGTLDPEIDLLSAFNELNKLTANTQASTSIVLGATAGNIITVTFPKCQIMDVKYGDRNGIVTAEMPLRFNANTTATDFCSILFT